MELLKVSKHIKMLYKMDKLAPVESLVFTFINAVLSFGDAKSFHTDEFFIKCKNWTRRKTFFFTFTDVVPSFATASKIPNILKCFIKCKKMTPVESLVFTFINAEQSCGAAWKLPNLLKCFIKLKKKPRWKAWFLHLSVQF